MLGQGGGYVGGDVQFGIRLAQWIRLRHKRTGRFLLAVNHHGPTPLNTGGVCGGKSVAFILAKIIMMQGRPGDMVVLLGDFNAGMTAATIISLKEHLTISGHGDPKNVILDYIFSNLPPQAVSSSRNLGGGGSDHNAISVTFRVGSGPLPERAGTLPPLEAPTPAPTKPKEPLVHKGCATLCELKGDSKMCIDRLKWVWKTKMKDKLYKDACPIALQVVIEECPHCDVCSLKDAGCPAPPLTEAAAPQSEEQAKAHTEVQQELAMPAEQAQVYGYHGWRDEVTDAQGGLEQLEPEPEPATEKANAEGKGDDESHTSSSAEPGEKGCATVCTLKGEGRMCVERIHWLAKTSLHGKPFRDACPEARKRVIEECPHCKFCPLSDAGCPLPAPKAVVAPPS